MMNAFTVTLGMSIIFTLWNYFFMVLVLPPQRLDKMKVNLKYVGLIYLFLLLFVDLISISFIRNLPFMGKGSVNFSHYETFTAIVNVGSAFIFGFLKWYRYSKEKGVNIGFSN